MPYITQPLRSRVPKLRRIADGFYFRMRGRITIDDNAARRLSDEAPVLDDHRAIPLVACFESQVSHAPGLLHEGGWSAPRWR